MTQRSDAVRAVALVRTDHFATWEDTSGGPAAGPGRAHPLRDGLPGRYGPLDWSSGEPRSGDEVILPVPHVLVVEGSPAAVGRAVAQDRERTREQLCHWQTWEEP